MMATKSTPKVTPCIESDPTESDGSSYSDCSVDPEKITVRRIKCRRRRGECSVRLTEIAQPLARTYHDLYYRHGWVMDEKRAARIRRKLDASKVMTLEELETVMADRERCAAKKVADKKKGRHVAERQTFDSYTSAHLDVLFERVAKHMTKKLCAKPVVAASQQPLIVSAANKRLIDYALEVVNNAMVVQLRAGRVKDLVAECPKAKREEKHVRRRVAEEVAQLAMGVLALAQSGEVKEDVFKSC